MTKYKKKFIYKISNDVNNKLYIGQANNVKDRMKKHKYETNLGEDIGKSAIHDAMRAIGFEHFKIEPIGRFSDYNDKEKYYIKKLNTLVPNGYNIEIGGNEPPHKYGEKHPMSKYSDEIIDALINDMLTQQYTQIELKKKYNMSQPLISSINLGEIRYNPKLSYPLIKKSPYYLTDNELADVKYLLEFSTCSLKEIATYYKVNLSSIKAINQGRNYHDDKINYPIRKFRGKSGSQPVEAILAKRSSSAIDTQREM